MKEKINLTKSLPQFSGVFQKLFLSDYVNNLIDNDSHTLESDMVENFVHIEEQQLKKEWVSIKI